MAGNKRKGGQLCIQSFFAPPAATSSRGCAHSSSDKDGDGAPTRDAAKRVKHAHGGEQVPRRSVVDLACEGTDSAQGRIPPRKHQLFAKAQRKLVAWNQDPGTAPDALASGRHEAAPAAKNKYTPLEQQFVALKEQHPDVLLMVEVGYKVRFFGRDAEEASKVCNIFCYPSHNFLTASIPVHRTPVYVRRLVHAGHKVGLVRQIETAAIKAAGERKYTPFERKLTALYTSATLDAGEKFDDFVLGESSEVDAAMPGDASDLQYVLCIAEDTGASENEYNRLGVTAVDCTVGEVLYGCCRRSQLAQSDVEAVLLKVSPCEIVIAGKISPHTDRLIRRHVASKPGCRMQRMARSEQDRDYKKMSTFLKSAPDHLQPMVDEMDGFTKNLHNLVLASLVAAIDYLEPFGLEGILRLREAFHELQTKHSMHLSSNALRQLEVLTTGIDDGAPGSLLHCMDFTMTKFGSRKLRSWLLQPLTKLSLIMQRQQAVRQLKGGHDKLDSVYEAVQGDKLLQGVPDLERGTTRMFHGTSSPAEAVVILQAIKKVASKLMPVFHHVRDLSTHKQVANGHEDDAPLVDRLVLSSSSPSVLRVAEGALSPLDMEASKVNDYIHLFLDKNMFPEVFELHDQVQRCVDHLRELLPILSRQAGGRSLDYVSIQNQGDWLIELPADRRDSPKGWQKVSSTKKFNRFQPPEVTAGIQALAVKNEELQLACSLAWKQWLTSFAKHSLIVRAFIQALAQLDALKALASLANRPGYCCPQLVNDAAPAQLVLRNSRHPILDLICNGNAVPNDVAFTGDGQRIGIITGPNMGGKSSLLRQAALICIMAQVGSFVPCDSAVLHVVDAIYTRMGASDNLMLGRSTFLEELGDAGEILTNATSRSLVICDELGRGTATHDGVAIACSTVEYLMSKVQCITLFVTHYPEVAELVKQHPYHICVYHMDYLLANASGNLMSMSNGYSNGPTDTVPSPSNGDRIEVPHVVFLYKLVPGAANASFGLNVARMAGIPSSVVMNAALKAKSLIEGRKSRQHSDASYDVPMELATIEVKSLEQVLCQLRTFFNQHDQRRNAEGVTQKLYDLQVVSDIYCNYEP